MDRNPDPYRQRLFSSREGPGRSSIAGFIGKSTEIDRACPLRSSAGEIHSPAFSNQVMLPRKWVRAGMPENLKSDGADLIASILDIHDIATAQVVLA